MHRRNMLIGLTGVALPWRAIASNILGSRPMVEAAPNPSASTHGSKPDAVRETLRPEDVLNLEAMRPRGRWYEATAPDTLDLTERAKLSINALTNNVIPERFYAVTSLTLDPAKPTVGYGTWDITPKNSRTLPTLRVMCGSDYNLEVDYGIIRALLSEVREDGLMYYPFDCNKPKNTSYPQSNASTVFAILHYYAQDGNPLWLKWVDLMCKGMRRVAIRVEDRAFYPMMCGIDPEGNWHMPNVQGAPPFSPEDPPPYNPTDEPKTDGEGYEGAARAEASRAISVLAMHYKLTRDRESLEMAKKVLRFVLKPGIWAENSDEKRYPGFEHGIWSGHFHNGTQGLNPILDMAMVTDSDWLKQFVREYYAHIQRNGVVRMGWFPAWSSLEKHKADASLGEITEPCAMGDFVVDAVRMSDAGLGDYWDDADYVVRNHLVEQQPDDLERLRRFCGVEPSTKADDLLRRFLGGFANGTPTRLGGQTYAPPACCTVNGAQGLYYAWHGITRFSDGIATVNLFLNRAAPWMDIDSYLPYEGKVVLHNKQAHLALVRIPRWIEAGGIRCRIERPEGLGNKTVTPTRSGNYLVFEGLRGKEKIVLEFPLSETVEKYTINGVKYTVTFKGSTVVDISPRDIGKYYQLYERDAYRVNKAPMRKVNRFVADKLIPLGTF